MSNRKLLILYLSLSLIGLAACAGAPTEARPPARGPAHAAGRAAAPSYDRLPLYFVENRGQTDPQVGFYVPGKDNVLYFASDGLTLAFTAPHNAGAAAPALWAATADLAAPGRGQLDQPVPAAQRWAVKLAFVGANSAAQPVGEAPTPAVFSYFQGQPDQWRAGVPTFAQLRYQNLWPGIDLVYSGLSDQLKYEFVVQPGADPAQIQLAYRGVSGVRLTADGQLEVTTPLNTLHDAVPLAYQVKGGQRVPVQMSYALNNPAASGPAAAYGYGFHLGAYDHALPVILDPTVVLYAGYIGGAALDFGRTIAVDANGNAYITGYTESPGTFPAMVGPDLTYNGDQDAFVAKVNADGTALVYAGYIGGSSPDQGSGIAVDSNGNAYITGNTASSNFPRTVGPDLTYNGGVDAFVAKVNAAGTALLYSGYIGGSAQDLGSSIAVDGNGNAYVTGNTLSSQASFPKTVGPSLVYGGGSNFGDAFVAKVNAAGTALTYAGYIGGAGDDSGNAIAIDSNGNAFVAGFTNSTEATFPKSVGPDLTFNGGGGDAFAAEVKADGTSLLYAGYVGGSGTDSAKSIALDQNGNAYITGETDSTQATFPVLGGPDLTYNGGAHDAFVAEIQTGGSNLVYAGYIGGSGDDFATGIAVDQGGNAYIAGETNSTQATFPVLGGPDLTYNGGANDAYVAKVNAGGASLAFASYIGGADNDQGGGIALDGSGGVYLTGQTFSDQNTFPVTRGPSVTYSGFGDAFAVKVVSFVASHWLYLPLIRR